MSDQINVRVPAELKMRLEKRNINPYEVAKKAWEQAVGYNDLESMMGEEEELFGRWAESFVRLHQYINKRLQNRESLLVAEEAQLTVLWKKIESRMKTREALMEEIPELKDLTYMDCFNWEKLFAIIDKYPQTLKGRLGISQIREGILYREVQSGNFPSVQEAHEKLKTEITLRAQQVEKELLETTSTEEFRKRWLIKQEELRLEELRKRKGLEAEEKRAIAI